MKRWKLLLLCLCLVVALASCRNTTQNVLRRNLQEFAGMRMYISLYALDGSVVYEGIVDGQVTQAGREGTSDGDIGDYIYWYDDQGRYHQTNLPYLLTMQERSVQRDSTP